MENVNNEFAGYAKHYDESKLFDLIFTGFKKIGEELVYLVLLMYYTLIDANTPIWAKTVIVSALGYFVFPVDLIPDAIPVIGYSDDLTVLIQAACTICVCLTPEIKKKAKDQLAVIFGDVDESAYGEFA